MDAFEPTLGLRDLPEDKWAGRPVDQQDIEAASGDPDDYFSARQRLAVARETEKAYRRHHLRPQQWTRRTREKFQWGLVIVSAPMGFGKTTAASLIARKWYRRGHMVFHPGGFLFGRVVNQADLYTLVDNVPLYSVILVDEAHSGLEASMSNTKGVSSFSQLCAGLRKKRCLIILMSAMAWQLAPSIKRMCTEVWRPLKMTVKYREGVKPGKGLKNPGNFTLRMEIYKNSPFNRAATGVKAKESYMGFGPPDKEVRWADTLAQRRQVMLAQASIDTFMPVEPGVARNYATKAAQDENSDKGFAPPREGNLKGNTDKLDAGIKQFLAACEEQKIRVTPIAKAVGVNARVVGMRIEALFGETARTGTRGGKLPSGLINVTACQEALQSGV